MHEVTYIPYWVIALVVVAVLIVMVLMFIDATREAYELADKPDINAYLQTRVPTAAQRRAAPYRVRGPSPYTLWLARRIQRKRAQRA